MDYGSIYDIIDDYGYQYDVFHDNEQHWMIMDEFMIDVWSQEMLQEGFQPLLTWFLLICSVIVLLPEASQTHWCWNACRESGEEDTSAKLRAERATLDWSKGGLPMALKLVTVGKYLQGDAP